MQQPCRLHGPAALQASKSAGKMLPVGGRPCPLTLRWKALSGNGLARQRLAFRAPTCRAVKGAESHAGPRAEPPGGPSSLHIEGLGFSGAGLLFPYYIGVVEALQSAGHITPETKLAGASAGSIIATAVSCGLEMNAVKEACWEVFKDYHAWGTAGRMRHTLTGVLHDVLPDDVHTQCHDRVFVSVTRLLPLLGGELVSSFGSKADLISALLTSCHIPLYFDSHVETYFRQGLYMDGAFGDFLPSPSGCQRVVKVSALPLSHAARLLGHHWDIAPDRFDPFSMFEIPRTAVAALLPATRSEFEDLIARGSHDTDLWVAREQRRRERQAARGQQLRAMY